MPDEALVFLACVVTKLFSSAGPEPLDTASTTKKLWEGFSHRLATSIWFITSGVRTHTNFLHSYIDCVTMQIIMMVLK